MIPDNQQGSAEEGQGVSVSSLQQLLTKGLAIQLQLDSLQRLQATLHGHHTWELRMKQVLQGMLVIACRQCCSLLLLAAWRFLPLPQTVPVHWGIPSLALAHSCA